MENDDGWEESFEVIKMKHNVGMIILEMNPIPFVEVTLTLRFISCSCFSLITFRLGFISLGLKKQKPKPITNRVDLMAHNEATYQCFTGRRFILGGRNLRTERPRKRSISDE